MSETICERWTCPFCRYPAIVKNDGSLRSHKYDALACPGSGYYVREAPGGQRANEEAYRQRIADFHGVALSEIGE